MKEQGHAEVCQRREVEESFKEAGGDKAAQQRQESGVKQWIQTNRRLLKLFTQKRRERENRVKDAESVETSEHETKKWKTVLKRGRERDAA